MIFTEPQKLIISKIPYRRGIGYNRYFTSATSEKNGRAKDRSLTRLVAKETKNSTQHKVSLNTRPFHIRLFSHNKVPQENSTSLQDNTILKMV